MTPTNYRIGFSQSHKGFVIHKIEGILTMVKVAGPFSTKEEAERELINLKGYEYNGKR